MVDDLPITNEHLSEQKEKTASDDELETLMNIVLEDWPASQADFPQEIKKSMP